jgi:flap endonuclease-1
MGIRQLNHFLVENCTQNAIRKLNLKHFAGKSIVIDTSIYLYKFAEKSSVAENIYLMIFILRQYNIIPIFVFDGKPPIEKKAVLIKRKHEKDVAEAKYNELKNEVASDAVLEEMDRLKKQFVRVTETDIAKSKDIMRACGVTYIESKGESDNLCAFLVKHGFAWACLSDDMDMFLYGCPRVIRHLSLLNHEAIYYDTAQILSELDMTQDAFNDISILSGTDYNITAPHSLSDTVRMYMKYREWLNSAYSYKQTGRNNLKTFYGWLVENTNYIEDLANLERIRKMFDLDMFLNTRRDEFKEVVDLMPFKTGDVDYAKLEIALKDDGFIFVK